MQRPEGFKIRLQSVKEVSEDGSSNSCGNSSQSSFQASTVSSKTMMTMNTEKTFKTAPINREGNQSPDPMAFLGEAPKMESM